MLYSTLSGLADPPNISSEEVGEIAARCNMIKYNAKKAQEESSKLYLCHYIVKNQPFIREAAVVEVRERSFDVIVLECGEVVRIHLHVSFKQKNLFVNLITFQTTANISKKTI